MALRFTSTYSNLDSNEYIIEIYDANFTGDATELNIQEDGVKFNVEGKGNDVKPGIIPTSYNVTYLVENATQEAFFTSLGSSDEDAFILKIKEAGNTFFIGKILSDIARRQDEPYGFFMTIRATDGLALLKDVNYAASEAQEYYEQINATSFEARIPNDIEYGSGDGNSSTFHTEEVSDQGSNYNNTTCIYLAPDDIIKTWRVSGEIEAQTNNPYEDVYVRLQHKPSGGAWTTIEEQQITFVTPGTTYRHSYNLEVVDYELSSGDEMRIYFEWQDDWDFLRFLAGGVFKCEGGDSRVNIKNVYGLAKDHFKNCLNTIGLNDFYGSEDPIFKLYLAWRETSQTNEDWPEYLGVPYNAFVTDFGVSPVSVVNCYQVLEAFCIAFNAYLTYKNGYYYFCQYDTLSAGTGRLLTYTKSYGTPTQSVQAFTSIEHDRTGGHFSYISALQRANIQFNRWVSGNYIKGIETVTPGTDVTANYTLSNIDLFFSLTYRILSYCTPQLTDVFSYAHVFRIKIKIGSYYLHIYNLNNSPSEPRTYSAPEWTTAENYIECWGAIIGPDPTNGIPITTGFEDTDIPPPPASGTLTVSIDYWKTIKHNTNDTITESTEVFTWEILDARLSQGEDPKEYTDEVINTDYTYAGNSKKLTLKTLFSDLVNLDNDPGKIKIWNGSTYADTGDWIEGSNTYGLQQLLAYSLINMRARPLLYWSGILDVGLFYDSLKIDGANHVLITGSYLNHLKTINGTYAKIARAGLTYTYLEYLGGSSSGSSSGTPSTGGGGAGPGTTTTTTILICVNCLTRTLEEVVEDVAITSIKIASLDFSAFRANDKLLIVNTDTGAYEEITVSTNYVDDADTVYINSFTPDNTYPINSCLVTPASFAERDGYRVNREINNAVAITGSAYTIPEYDLTKFDGLANDEINKRLKLFIEGIKLRYPTNYTISFATGLITFNYTLANETLEYYVLPL